MSGAAAGGRDGGDLPERRGDARRESGLDDSGADDRELPPSDATENALRVQSLDIPAVAAQLSLSPRGLLSRLLRGSDSEGEGNVVTVDVPVVRDEDPPGGGANHDARSSLSSSFLSRRARRAEATDAANAAASRALFAATATEPPTRLASLSLHPTTEDERLESLAPLLERGAGARDGRAPPGRASPRYAQTETDSADGFRGYLVGVPVGSALDRDRIASAEARETLETGETDEARLARAVADATDGEVGENAAAAAAARVCGDRMGNQSETRLAAADDDVRVRRVIFAVPSRTSFGEGTAFDSGTASGASPETLPSDSQRRPLKFGGASTRFSLPTAVTNVTLEMRTGDERDASDDARTVTVDDASSNGDEASETERSFFVANGVSESERKPPNTAYAMRRLRASVVVERRVPVIGWLILAAAVVSLSAMGTMVTLERSKPFTQSSWRAQSVLLIAAPWAAAKLKKQGLRGFRAARTRRRALLVALCWSGWFLTLFYGLATTSIAHAYVLTNTTSAVIVVHTLLTGNAVPRSHVAGVALAMAGAGVVMWQSSFQSSGDAKKNGASSGAATVAGDAVVAAGAVSGAAFLLLAKTTREEVELSLLLVLQMLVNLPISLALALSLEGCSFVTPLDAKRGVVGWLAPSQIGKQLVISVCGTIIGTCGYVASLKYLAPTVVAIAMLCEPILAALIGWAAGVNAFPDWKTCSGMALVALGTAVIAVDAGRARARAVDVDAHRNAANG
jgi:drug/metabolite transporter (DMT)-like permease